MNAQTVLMFILGGLCVFVVSFGGMFYVLTQANRASKKVNVNTYSTLKKSGLFDKLCKIPLVGMVTRSIQLKLSLRYAEDTSTIKAKAFGVALGSFAISVVVFFAMMFFLSRDTYTLILISMVSIYVFSMCIDIFCGNEIRFLRDLVDTIYTINHKFNDSHNAIEALYSSIEESEYNVAQHCRYMYNCIKMGKPALLKYHKKCNNKFLKIMASVIYVTQDSADVKINDVPVFIKNMHHIVEEIHMDILKREMLIFWLRASVVISMLPLMFIRPIETWMYKYFSSAAYFFESSTGFYFRVIILASAFTCYYVIRRLESSATGINQSTHRKDVYWEDELLAYRPIKILVGIQKPKNGSSRDRRVKRLIADSGSFVKIDWIYLHKILWFIVGVLVSVFIVFAAHRLDIVNTISKVTYAKSTDSIYSSMIGESDNQETKELALAKDVDTEVVGMLRKGTIAKSDVSSKVNELLYKKGGAITDVEVKKVSDYTARIDEKYDTVEKIGFTRVDIIFVLICAFLASLKPVVAMNFQKYLRKVEMQDEIFQFHMVIILLMHYENASNFLVLEWMANFSNIFYDPIIQCLTNYSHSPKKALENLKASVRYKPFIRLIDNLLSAEDVDLVKAFESIELERSFYKDERKETNKRQVDSRVNLGQMVGFIPMAEVTALYIIYPLLLNSYTQLNEVMKLVN